MRLNGSDVTGSFKPDPAAGRWLGVVYGMADGSNTLTVSSPSDPTLQGSAALKCLRIALPLQLNAVTSTRPPRFTTG